MQKNEEKVLRAAARAQADTGVAISVHAPRTQNPDYPSSRWGVDILDILKEEGANPHKIIIGHLDRSTYADLKYQMEISTRGAYIEYDLWGTETYFNRFNEGTPSDLQRIEAISKLIENGCLEHLLFSQDVFIKLQRTKYGGYGYSHLLRNCVPMLVKAGVSDNQLVQILVTNPRNALRILAN